MTEQGIPGRDIPEQSTEALLATLALSGDPRLRAVIIERQEGLVRSLAQKFARPGVPVEDLAQSAWVALIGAVDRFDPIHGTRFSTYAIHCMAGAIKRHFRDQTWALKVPRRLKEIAGSLNRMQDKLRVGLGREPTILEMAAAFQVSEEELLQALEAHAGLQPRGLDDLYVVREGNPPTSVAETTGALDPGIERLAEVGELQMAISVLDQRRQQIVRMRFFDGFSQREAGLRLGCSQMQISRLERSALSQLRLTLREGSRTSALNV